LQEGTNAQGKGGEDFIQHRTGKALILRGPLKSLVEKMEGVRPNKRIRLTEGIQRKGVVSEAKLGRGVGNHTENFQGSKRAADIKQIAELCNR